ncbi:MAG: nuclease [Deltaproteobacteria bacterium]|jgi:ERCC4-type nuclease|nr:nuclease [Deltaproteobacteria bacterium]
MKKKSYRTTVIADDRERNSAIIQSFSNMETVSFSIQRLPLGDYFVDNHLIFERKTLNDFAVSVIDGRIFKQAISLVNSNYKSVLILEGTGKELTKTGVSREALQGALITVSIVLGIPVLRSRDSSESARLILYTARQIKSIIKGPVRRQGWRPKGKRKKQLFILQGLPDVGSSRAARLLDAFGSVEAVMTATIEELQSVEGIGNYTAERIKWAVS